MQIPVNSHNVGKIELHANGQQMHGTTATAISRAIQGLKIYLCPHDRDQKDVY